MMIHPQRLVEWARRKQLQACATIFATNPDVEGQKEGYARGEALIDDLRRLMGRSMGLEHYYLEAAVASLQTRLYEQHDYIRECERAEREAKAGAA
jgi:hypothetical protein